MRSALALLIGMAPLLSACPPPSVDPTPANSTSGPPQENPPSPPFVNSVCENISAGGGLDESAGVVAECPEITSDALQVGWMPQRALRNRCRSCVYFAAKNLLDEEIEVEFEITTNMEGSDRSTTLPLPPHTQKRVFEARGRGTTEINLQLGYAFHTLEADAPAEVHIAARLVSPVDTPMMKLSTLVVKSSLDELRYIDDIDYLER